MSSLPEEVYSDILVRLPLKSICVCKCVCKRWFSIISKPEFAKLHVDLTTQRQSYSLMFQDFYDLSFKSISYDSLSLELDDILAVAAKIDLTPKTRHEIDVLGFCNGLVYGWNIRTHLFFMWNPTGKEFKMLPKLEGTENHYYGCLHGIGYDEKTGDYKLVLIRGNKESQGCLVQVYSLKSDSWKCFGSNQFGFHVDGSKGGVFLNGALHWLKPIAMDVSEERLKELQLPKTEDRFMDMGVLEGRLCVLSDAKVTKMTLQVWVMQEYGVQESWTRLYTVMYESIISSSLSYLGLVGFLKNGEILFKDVDAGKIILFDPKSGAAKKLNTYYRLEVRGAMGYFESLVSPNSITAVDEGNRELA